MNAGVIAKRQLSGEGLAFDLAGSDIGDGRSRTEVDAE